MTKKEKYPCVYRLTDDCPVKKEYILKPESLVKFCAECPILRKFQKQNGNKLPKKFDQELVEKLKETDVVIEDLDKKYK